jgi:hypothetical protein
VTTGCDSAARTRRCGQRRCAPGGWWPTPRAGRLDDPATSDAARIGTRYFVAGALTYSQEGNEVRVPLAPTRSRPSQSQPLPPLLHQRDVLADDPFTDAIEPSVPYSLAVMVQKPGRGKRATSASPPPSRRSSTMRRDCSSTSRFSPPKWRGSLSPSLTADCRRHPAPVGWQSGAGCSVLAAGSLHCTTRPASSMWMPGRTAALADRGRRNHE